MTHRNFGLMSLGLAAIASLLAYATTMTNAQDPVGPSTGSVVEHSRNDDHNHGSDDQRQESQPQVYSPPENAVVVPAPSGGPPPLPSETIRQDPQAADTRPQLQSPQPPTIFNPAPANVQCDCGPGGCRSPIAGRYTNQLRQDYYPCGCGMRPASSGYGYETTRRIPPQRPNCDAGTCGLRTFTTRHFHAYHTFYDPYSHPAYDRIPGCYGH